MNTSNQKADGFALPLVLIILALLTALSFGLTRTVSANTQLLQERKAEWSEEMQVRDALEEATLILLVGDYDPKSVRLDSTVLPLNGRSTELNKLQVRIQSWSGLYGLSLFGHKNADVVLRKMVDSKTAHQISAELSDWIDEDNRSQFRGGEASDYASRRMPQRPRNAPLRSIDELMELPSVTPLMMNGTDDVPGFRDIFLVGGDDNFDLGTAPDILVAPLLGLPDSTAGEVIQAREANDWSKVRFLVDENHWVFNDHPMFYKGLKYRLEFENSRGVKSRVQMKLTPYDSKGLYEVIDWQVPDYLYE